MTARRSRRLRLFAAGLRLLVKPVLVRQSTPQEARRGFERAARLWLRRPPYLVHLRDDGAPPIHWIWAGRPRTRGAILYLHGGAYVAGSAETHAGLAGRLSRLTGLRVAVPEYRLAPENPAPAAFEDALAAHARLCALGYRPDEIVLAGDSAGGGLALALLAALCARGARPAGAVAFSPWTDLAGRSASLVQNAAADPLLPATRLDEAIALARGSLPVEDARLSPVYAAFDAPPPVLIQAGETEILRDDAVRMAEALRAAGGDVRLELWDGVPHAWQIFDGWFPEARDALRAAARFIGEVAPADQAPGP